MHRTLLLFLFATPAFCQSDLTHSGAWFMYFGDHLWSEHWGLHAEGQLRRVDGVLHGNQLFFRPGIEYKLNDHFTFTVAYVNVQNYSFDDFSFPKRIPEQRIDEEAVISHPIRALKFQHRIRQEQRFGKYAEDWQYRNRTRYRLLVRIPITKKNYFSAYNEVFANYGAHVARAFDQNWTYGAIGRDFGAKGGRLEIGYLYQHQRINDVRVRHIHDFQIAYFSKLPFGKRR